MAITAFTATKNYADDATFTQNKLDAFVDALDTWLANEVETKCPDKTGAETVTGAWIFSGGVDLNEGLTLKRTASAAGAYTILTSDLYIGKTAITGGGDTLTLPAASSAGEGKVYIIVDESGAAATNNITIDGNGSETIDGSTTTTISTNYGALRLITDGSNWFSW